MADPDRPNGPQGDQGDDGISEADWDARRAALDARLSQHRAQAAADDESRNGKRESGMQGMAKGLKIASEFVSGIMVGAFIGYGIDYFFGTLPFGLIIFLLLGFAAGVLNVVRGQSTTGTGP